MVELYRGVNAQRKVGGRRAEQEKKEFPPVSQAALGVGGERNVLSDVTQADSGKELAQGAERQNEKKAFQKRTIERGDDSKIMGNRKD